MPLKKSGHAPSQRRASSGPLRLIFPPALNWVLLAYAVFAIAVGWAYVASRIHTEYVQTLEAERNSLRGIGATLRSATLAMLNDGVGAAVAAANELQSAGGIALAGGVQISSTLQKQLTGGDYVRFLFLADSGRFALSSREKASNSPTPPDWRPNVPRKSGPHLICCIHRCSMNWGCSVRCAGWLTAFINEAPSKCGSIFRHRCGGCRLTMSSRRLSLTVSESSESSISPRGSNFCGTRY